VRSYENEPFVVNRDVRAVIVPAGAEVMLRTGQAGYITQALGGSFTVYMEGNLFRISGEDADAIGKDVVKPPELPPNATEEDVRKLAWEQMRTCYDPEIPINIVDLGLVYEVDVQDNGDVDIRYSLTTMGCPIGPLIEDQIRAFLAPIEGLGEVRPELVFRPAWSPEMMSDEAKAALGIF
jgi:probable FeS assembly SUF system protein SufT